MFFVTRQKDNAIWQQDRVYNIDDTVDSAVIKDEQILETNDQADVLL